MKKIFLIIALTTLAAVADAQFVVSAQLGGFCTNGSSNALRNQPDTVPGQVIRDTIDQTLPTHFDLTGGIKFGYQTGRLQFGLGASFSWHNTRSDQSAGQYNNTYPRITHLGQMPLGDINDYEGWYTERYFSYSIAPYLRYELIEVGDVAFFAELSGFFAKSTPVTRHDYLDWYFQEKHYTVDTTLQHNITTTEIGGKITPGLSWQLSPHCYVDLYLDVLAFTFQKSTTVEDVVTKEYYNGVVDLHRENITTTELTDMGFGVTGSPWLSDRNWVRVGFNYTF